MMANDHVNDRCLGFWFVSVDLSCKDTPMLFRPLAVRAVRQVRAPHKFCIRFSRVVKCYADAAKASASQQTAEVLYERTGTSWSSDELALLLAANPELQTSSQGDYLDTIKNNVGSHLAFGTTSMHHARMHALEPARHVNDSCTRMEWVVQHAGH